MHEGKSDESCSQNSPLPYPRIQEEVRVALGIGWLTGITVEHESVKRACAEANMTNRPCKASRFPILHFQIDALAQDAALYRREETMLCVMAGVGLLSPT